MPLRQTDQPNLLLVDDDVTFGTVLANALRHRGYDVLVAHNGESAVHLIEALMPEYAIVDLRLPDMSGLKLVERMKGNDENTRIVVLTGYGSICTAIDAIKLGAIHYLTKPANADQIIAAFEAEVPRLDGASQVRPLSVDRLEWEHIQRVLADAGGNISAAARAMNMHRRTLQRKLGKNPPRA